MESPSAAVPPGRPKNRKVLAGIPSHTAGRTPARETTGPSALKPPAKKTQLPPKNHPRSFFQDTGDAGWGCLLRTPPLGVKRSSKFFYIDFGSRT